MSKTLKKVSLYVLGALLVLSCVMTLALSAKTAKADSLPTDSIGGIIFDGSGNQRWSYVDAVGGGTNLVQAGENGVQYTFAIKDANTITGWESVQLAFGPDNAVQAIGQQLNVGHFVIAVMVNENNNLYAMYYDHNSTEVFGAVGHEFATHSTSGYTTFTIAFQKVGSIWKLIVNGTEMGGNNFNSITGGNFMNGSLKTNVAISNFKSNLPVNVALMNAQGITDGSGGGGDDPQPPTPSEGLPSGAAGGVIYGSGTTRWSYVDAIGGGTNLFQAAEYGVMYTFAIKDVSAISGTNSIELAFGPDNAVPSLSQSSSAGHFILAIMVHENGSLYAMYYDNTGAERFGANEDSNFGTHNTSSYTTFTIAIQKVNGVWNIIANGKTLGGNLFNQHTGGAFMDASFYTNVAITNTTVPANVALMNAQGITDGSGGGGGGGGTDPATGSTELNATLSAGQSYNFASATNKMLQSGTYGFQFKVGIKLNAVLTGYPGVEICFAPKADLTDMTSNGCFRLGFMLNKDNNAIYLNYYSKNSTTELIQNYQVTFADALNTTSFAYFVLAVQSNGSVWELKVDGVAIDNGLFNSNTGGAFKNSSNLFNINVANPADANSTMTVNEFSQITSGGGSGGGGETVVIPEGLPIGAAGGVLGQGTWNYKSSTGNYLKAGKDGIEVKIGVRLKAALTNGQYPGVKIHFGAVDAPNSNGTFHIDFMLNGDHGAVFYMLYKGANDASQIVTASGATQLNGIDVLSYAVVTIRVQNDGSGWKVYANGKQMGGNEFNSNNLQAFLNGSYQTNITISCDHEYAEVALYNAYPDASSAEGAMTACKALNLTKTDNNKKLVQFAVNGMVVAKAEVNSGSTVSKPTGINYETLPDMDIKWCRQNGTEWNFTSDTVTSDIKLEAKLTVNDIQEVPIDDGGGSSGGGGVHVDTGSGCGSRIAIEIPVIAVLLTAVAATVIIVKKRKA